MAGTEDGAKRTGGSWEDLSRRWNRDSNPGTGRMRARYYEDDGKVILGPDGDPIHRVVDRDIQMGFTARRDSAG